MCIRDSPYTIQSVRVEWNVSNRIQFRMGSLKFRSSDPEVGLVFKSDLLARAFPIKEGEVFSADKIRKALDNYKKLYGEYGYIDFVPEPVTEIDDVKKVVNLTMEFDQDVYKRQALGTAARG